MTEEFEACIRALLRMGDGESTFAGPLRDTTLSREQEDGPETAQALNAAFLVSLAGPQHALADHAKKLLNDACASTEWNILGRFYRQAIDWIGEELLSACREHPKFMERLQCLAECLRGQHASPETPEFAEKFWSVFCPEAAGIRGNERAAVEALRRKRTVRITQLNPHPIAAPARQILFTSNVLLTVPSASQPLDDLGLAPETAERLRHSRSEDQLFWYDHPIQIGVAPEKNEVLYGLSGLESAFAFERTRSQLPPDSRMKCVLSVSVTHGSLRGIAKDYLEAEFTRCGGFEGIDVYVFTEAETRRIIDDILVPAAVRYLDHSEEDARDLLNVLGVDGAYGRHYSFLKAIAAFWSVLIDPEIEGTFKIDLDQVFPQNELVEESGASAFDHFLTPLWGAHGVDSQGNPVELGMIAGALVNEGDIQKSLFTPDVEFPQRSPATEELIFFSQLPQALSTQAEMMARYDTQQADGRTRCLQRVHVTGGTNGIRVDSLRRHRPFTPSFFGRAEDQAYIFSAFANPGERLAYVHEPGLVMRHDKEAFAQEAIAVASTGKLIGDYIRILYFSAYGAVIGDGMETVKLLADPFTGCFVSRIPITVACLRFALKAESLSAEGQDEEALQFVHLGASRLAKAVEFARGDNSELRHICQRERYGWTLYHEALSALEAALADGDAFATDLKNKAQTIVQRSTVAS